MDKELIEKCLLTDEIRTIARSMITASHYNQLPETVFDNYLNEILTKAIPIIAEEIKRELEAMLDIHDDGGYCRISNHFPYSSYQSYWGGKIG